MQRPLLLLLISCTLLSGCSSEPTTDELLEQGRSAIRAKDWTTTRKIKDQLAQRKGAEVETKFLEANLYMNVRNLDAVMERVGEIASDPRIREDCLMLAVHCFTQINDLPSAMRTLEELVAQFPDNVEAHRLLSAHYYDFGALQRVMHHCQRVSELAPEDPRPDRLMGLVSKDFEKHELAITHYLESLKRATGDPTFSQADEVRIELAEVYIRMRRYQEAQKQLKQLSPEATPRLQATSYAYQAECAMNQGALDEAKRLAQLSIQQDSTLPRGHMMLGEVTLQTGDPQTARDALQTAARLEPGNDRIYFQLSNALRQLDETEAADQAFAKHEQIKTLKLKFIEFNVRSAQEPNNAAIRVETAAIAEQLQDWEAAGSWYRAALGIDPQNEDAIAGMQRVIAIQQQPRP